MVDWWRFLGICYLMERYGDNFKTVNLDNVLGPIITTNILKNKCFLLTCTIPIKSVPNGTPGERQVCINNNFSNSSQLYFIDKFCSDTLLTIAKFSMRRAMVMISATEI